MFRKHPGGLSSLMFSFSALVVYSVFRTSHTNSNINSTSGYLDLSPLYGNDQATQDRIRLRNGRGYIHPDVFAEDRILLLPPASLVLLILFSRNHNYIARRLLEINERGTWSDPSTIRSNHIQMLRQDEEIFNIARLCNCAWFAAVVLSDYLSAILGLVNQVSVTEILNEVTARRHEGGRGNARSVEFNCLYRWHTTTSVEDEQWFKLLFTRLFRKENPNDFTTFEFYTMAKKVQELEPGVEHWTFGHLERQEDGTYKDSDLAQILQNSTSHHAASFGARGTPEILRLFETMGIESGRHWGVCSLNDFRRTLGLKPYTSFYEWNPNASVAEAAERLYGEIDNLELYVGLQAEDTQPITEGFGLCSGYTISHVVLSDLITLIRNDRFYTQDFTPHNMTAWGFADCQRDPNGWGFGSVLGRLLLRTLPDHYDEWSVFTWFPFMNPTTMQDYLEKRGKSDEYSYTRPEQRNPAITVRGHREVDEILQASHIFVPEYDHAKEIFGFIPVSLSDRSSFSEAFATSSEAIDEIGKYFYTKTEELISASSYPLINTNTSAVDIVRDVLRLVPLYWVASELACIPLKEKQNQPGPYTPQQLYGVLGDVYQFVFLDIEPGKYMVLKRRVQDHVKKISPLIQAVLPNSEAGRDNPARTMLLKHLFDLGHSDDQIVVEILVLISGIAMEISVALTKVLNVLLDNRDFSRLLTHSSSAGEQENHPTLASYAIEALRIDPFFSGVYRAVKNDHDIGALKFKQCDRLYLDVANAVMNEEVYPNPTAFDVTRPRRKRHIQLDVAFKVFDADIALELVVQVLRCIFSLQNVRRGPGQSGKLTRFRDETFRDVGHVYLDADRKRSPWPTSMVMFYDVARVV